MGTFNPKSFSEPYRLKTIEPCRLQAFLHVAFHRLAGRGETPTAGVPYPPLDARLLQRHQPVPLISL